MKKEIVLTGSGNPEWFAQYAQKNVMNLSVASVP